MIAQPSSAFARIPSHAPEPVSSPADPDGAIAPAESRPPEWTPVQEIAMDPILVALCQRAAPASASHLGERTSAEWARCWTRWGIVPVAVPTGARHLRPLLRTWPIRSVLLAGTEGTRSDPAHERSERSLLRHARANGLAVVGLGGGALTLLRYFGGRVGAGGRARVRDLPAPLRPVTVDSDRVLAFVHATEPIAGVFWTPGDGTAPGSGLEQLALDTLRLPPRWGSRPSPREFATPS